MTRTRRPTLSYYPNETAYTGIIIKGGAPLPPTENEAKKYIHQSVRDAAPPIYSRPPNNVHRLVHAEFGKFFTNFYARDVALHV